MSMTTDRSVVRSVLNRGLVLLGLLPAVAAAQEATTVSGEVTAAAGGAPVVGASVIIPTLRLSTTTDAQGKYRFTVPASATGEVTLSARRIGYVTRSVQIYLAGGPLRQGFAVKASAGAPQPGRASGPGGEAGAGPPGAAA